MSVRVPKHWAKEIASGTAFGAKAAASIEMLERLPAEARSAALPQRTAGKEKVGTALKARITSLLNVKKKAGCGCNNLATEMDRGGIAWCEANREYIVGHLIANKDMLASALSESGSMAHAAIGFVTNVPFVSDAVLRVGANWLLSAAIDEVRSANPIRAARVIRANAGRAHRVARLSKTQEQLYNAMLAAQKPNPDPFTGTPVLHFGAHLWPVRGHWDWHAERWNDLASRINGRCIVGVVTDATTNTLEEVRLRLSDRFELFEGPNTKDGENPTFERFQTMIPSGQNDVLLYAHGKGVRAHTFASPAVRIWCEIMYETAIFNHARIIEHMANGYKMVGSFRTYGDVPHKPTYRWHYSGTFWALRAKHLPNKPVRPGYGGVEAWPGYHFPPEQCFCEFSDNLPMGQLYSDDYMKAQLPLIEKWRKQNAP